MDFSLSAEQTLLRDSVARFATERGATHADRWTSFADLGWLAIGAPEEIGGFGGPVEQLLLMEQLGRGCVGSPYVAQAVLAGSILRDARSFDLLEELAQGHRRFAVAYEEPHARYDPAKIETALERSGRDWIVSGMKTRVLDASTADTLIVSARMRGGVALVAVPRTANGVSVRPYPAEDGYDVANLGFEGVRVSDETVVARDGLELLENGLDHATAALCAEALGLCSFMLEATVEYTKQREQFGVPLSSFQALRHRMAEMYVELELLRSMAYFAAMTLEGERDARMRKRGVSAAKAQVAKSGRFIGQQTIQLHGGIGMSEEYRVGHYFKRMTLVERSLGDRSYHLQRFAALRHRGQR
jgi:alkylation response protein AidB-like acyl-CoA dehydrogenase